MRMRRRMGKFEYMGVKESNGERSHVHLVFRGKYIEQQLVSSVWNSLHSSTIVDIREVKRPIQVARYLAKYLAKDLCARYWCSYDWVFKGWLRWSSIFKKVFNVYPKKDLLISIANAPLVARRAVLAMAEGG